MVKDLSIEFDCVNCGKHIDEVPVFALGAEPWCADCYHAEVKRTQTEDLVDDKKPWLRTRPPKYALSKNEWKEYGY